ncbi:alcohol dehydrogenase [Lojkania enalia]|uniref:Alcohol dehydrogenase n=1 Tax=Lojkania enalia TaxID=147567 RepID=A0A9P4MVE2_9PLEO|nr:alcohol dehydrogenase [Didymosphaeria enalia]
MGALPNTQHAVVACTNRAWAFRKELPVPRLEDGEVLIKIEAVALNPSDAKQLENCPVDGAISGSDLAGTVVKVSKSMEKDLHIGDRVTAMVLGCNPRQPDNGAFAQYAAVRAGFCVKLPETISFEAGTTLTVGLVTCGLALRSLGLVDATARLASPKNQDSNYVLVYGGSTATGALAIQILRFLGYAPMAVCSPSSFPLVREVGAHLCVDYRNSGGSDEIRNTTNGQLRWVLDCIGSPGSTTFCYTAFGNLDGRYTALNPVPDRLRLRKRRVVPDWILGYTVFGSDVNLSEGFVKKAASIDTAFTIAWLMNMESLLSRGELQPHPTSLQPDGLRGIERDLLLLRQGSTSGKKLVYMLHDT